MFLSCRAVIKLGFRTVGRHGGLFFLIEKQTYKNPYKKESNEEARKNKEVLNGNS